MYPRLTVAAVLSLRVIIKSPMSHIRIDSIFSPVKKVIYFHSTEHRNLLAPEKHAAFKL